jgi:hypothetical protein
MFPQVAEQGQVAELAFLEQALEGFLLVAASGQADLPGVRRGQLTIDQSLPEGGLRFILRLGVGQEQHVTQLDGTIAIVFRELVFVELHEGARQAALQLGRQRTLPVTPVDGQHLRQLIRALDHAHDGVGRQAGAGAGFQERVQQEQRDVPQLALFTRLDGDIGKIPRRNAHGVLGDAVRNGLAVLVEPILPEEAGHDGATQRFERGFLGEAGSPLMGFRGRGPGVDRCHFCLLANGRRAMKATQGNSRCRVTPHRWGRRRQDGDRIRTCNSLYYRTK